MAKKRAAGGPNKAQLIRDYMKDNPKAGPKIVAEAVNGQHDLEVSAQYVSTIKTLDGKKSGKKKLGRPKGKAAAVAGDSDVISSLLQAKKLADAMGGVAKAKLALDALAKLGL